MARSEKINFRKYIWDVITDNKLSDEMTLKKIKNKISETKVDKGYANIFRSLTADSIYHRKYECAKLMIMRIEKMKSEISEEEYANILRPLTVISRQEGAYECAEFIIKYTEMMGVMEKIMPTEIVNMIMPFLEYQHSSIAINKILEFVSTKHGAIFIEAVANLFSSNNEEAILKNLDRITDLNKPITLEFKNKQGEVFSTSEFSLLSVAQKQCSPKIVQELVYRGAKLLPSENASPACPNPYKELGTEMPMKHDDQALVEDNSHVESKSILEILGDSCAIL